ncbi:MAG: CRISPR-associated protein Cas4 [Thermomicrobiales bacterium]|nr:CRISPR-associated protein Cas4 [Thermomicrobiales bacterium]
MIDASPVVTPVWRDEDLVPISALEHWSYCPRQCGLIHLEQTFEDNLYTLRGRRVHERAHEPDETSERGVRTVRAMTLWSPRLGLIGRADIVEFHGDRPLPVEYKSGARREWRHEALQLCAQALCLEEMTGQPAPEGAIWHHATRRRRPIVFDDAQRAEVERATAAVRAMVAGDRLPPAVDDPRCRHCSLHDACLPEIAAHPARVRGFLGELFYPAPDDGGEEDG